nr:NnrS family protein [Marinicella litoralis]
MLGYCFCLLVLSATSRVVLPLLDVIAYLNVILLSGSLWIGAYALFVVRYLPIWLKPRVDGKPG